MISGDSGSRRLRRVLIVGGGAVGWSAAAALKVRIPGLDVSVLDKRPPDDAIADRVWQTLPSAVTFHQFIGLDELRLLQSAKASYRLATRFRSWGSAPGGYLHGFGTHGATIGSTLFHQQWLRFERRRGTLPFSAYATYGALAAAERFRHPDSDLRSPLSAFGYSPRLDAADYRETLRAHAVRAGARVLNGEVAALVRREASGDLSSVVLDDGREIAADLFIDCSGPQADLLSRIDSRFVDWRQWLPCDEIGIRRTVSTTTPSICDECVADADGWYWRTPTGDAQTTGSVGIADCAGSPRVEARDRIRFTSGIRPEPWQKNVIAIGDAAGVLDPLEGVNLHLAHSAVMRLALGFPNVPIPLSQAAEHNRVSLQEAEQARDFICLHYALGPTARSPFWRYIATIDWPESLRHRLRLFRRRARIPVHDHAIFARDNWLAVLIGQGARPEILEPAALAVSEARAIEAMATIARHMRIIAQDAPDFVSYRGRVRNMACASGTP